MNRMEMKLLFDLDFRLYVTAEMFENYRLKLEKEYAVEHQNDRPIYPWSRRRLAKQR